MSERLRITIGTVALTITLRDTLTARAILEAVPFEAPRHDLGARKSILPSP